MLLLLLALLLALGVSAFFTAAEMAIFSLGESRVRTLVDEGFRGARSLARLRSRPERLLVLLRLGDALGDVSAAVCAGYIAVRAWGLPGLAVAVGVATLLVLLAGELAPISFAADKGVRVALTTAPVLDFLSRALSPILLALERVPRIVPQRPEEVGSVAESEIRQLTVLGHAEGVIEEHERQIIERAFQLDERKAWDIMTPRVDIFAWPSTVTLAEISPLLPTVPYSRVPVYDESIDHITGVLYVRDAHQALISGQRDVPLAQLAREPLIVPGSVPLTKLLRDFQTRRIHLAIVVDEYGGTDGLVTLEDVLEELVGEIADEKETLAEEPIVRVSRNEVIAAGDADLRELNHIFNVSFPSLEHRSLNGYLLEELGRVPEPGEALERAGIVIEILEAAETQVLKARLRRAREAEPPPAEAVPSAAAGRARPAAREAEPGAGRPPASTPPGSPGAPGPEGRATQPGARPAAAG